MIKLITWLLGLLPDSWLANAEATEQISEFISYMNYFIPFDKAIEITTAWLACIIAYFAYSWASTFIEAVKEFLH